MLSPQAPTVELTNPCVEGDEPLSLLTVVAIGLWKLVVFLVPSNDYGVSHGIFPP